jgi:thiamine biosynthesis protein ThiS
MIEIVFNGQTRQVLEGTTIEDLLATMGIPKRYCAVERNREIVPREQMQSQRLQSGDELEVVTLVGGG